MKGLKIIKLPVLLNFNFFVILFIAFLLGWSSSNYCQTLPTQQIGTVVSSGNGSQTNIEVLASDILFLPNAFSSNNQLRASLIKQNNALFFTDSSDFPLKKISTTGGEIVSMAPKVVGPENVTIHGGYAFWIDGDRLYKTSLDQKITTLLAKGLHNSISGDTSDIVIDDTSVFWVSTVQLTTCSPSCDRVIQKVPIDGGTPISLVNTNKQIVALTSDSNDIYWEELGNGPITLPDGPEGSAIKRIAKVGGNITILVNGALNGLIEPPTPPSLPGSWFPTGGITVNESDVIFSDSGFSQNRIMKVPISGGPITILGTIATNLNFALHSFLSITVDASNVYWIDTGNSAIDALPIAGGNFTTLASGLNSPTDLAVNADAVYWTEGGTTPETGTIRQVPIMGGAPSSVVESLDSPSSLALDSSRLYWTESWRVAELSANPANPTTTVASGIATDLARIVADDQYVYILDGFIKKVPIIGGVVEKLTSQAGFGDLSVSLGDLSLDTNNVYWTLNTIGPQAPFVKKILKTGGPVVTLSNGNFFVSPQDCVRRVQVAGNFVYWSSGAIAHPVGCAINKVSIDGGPKTTVLDVAFQTELAGLNSVLPPLDFVADEKDIYFSLVEAFSNSLNKLSINGGNVSVFPDASSVGIPLIDDEFGNLIYLMGNPSGCCTLAKESKTGGGKSYITEMGSWSDSSIAIEAITSDKNSVYWTEVQSGTIKKATWPLPLTIETSFLPKGEVGVKYDASLLISGGVLPYTTYLNKGALPLGLLFGNSNSPKISGIPTKKGTYKFSVAVTDNTGSTISQQLNVNIRPKVNIANNMLKIGKRNRPYKTTLTANGGIKPYTWSIMNGNLPNGLVFDTTNGTISGIPNKTGAFEIKFHLADPLGGSVTKTLYLTIISDLIIWEF